MQSLEELLLKYEFPKRTIRNGFAVQEIERADGFPLPVDYEFFLDNFAEYDCFIGPQFLKLWDANDLLEINYGYQVFEFLTNILAIGNNGASECMGLEYLGPNNYRIVIFQFIGMDESKYHIEIGTSFTDMIIRLDNGKEWFA